MTDVLGYRATFGVIGPSTNTIVQPDFEAFRPHGVTNHYSRIATADVDALSDEDFMAGTRAISERVSDAVERVMTARISHLVMGMSAITFYDGVEGGAAFKNKVESASGVGVSMGSEAVVAALKAFGAGRNIAFVSPYYPKPNAEVTRYFEESGYRVVRDMCLRCQSWTAISRVTERDLVDILKALDGDDIDALVQVGTNMSMVRLAAAAELWLDKPVIAINAATYWHALRTMGISDPVFGYGRLLQSF